MAPDAPSIESSAVEELPTLPLKPFFVRPEITVLGDLVELTGQFGGSLTPDERTSQGLDGLCVDGH
jgi:hypothetical protein